MLGVFFARRQRVFDTSWHNNVSEKCSYDAFLRDVNALSAPPSLLPNFWLIPEGVFLCDVNALLDVLTVFASIFAPGIGPMMGHFGAVLGPFLGHHGTNLGHDGPLRIGTCIGTCTCTCIGT